MSILSIVRSRVFLGLLVLGAVLAVAAACSDDGGGDTSGGDTTDGDTPTVDETAEIKSIPVIMFDRDEITIAADTDVTISHDNTDEGVPHNFAVYTSQDAAESEETALALTEICTGQCVDAATVNLGTGEYFFRCDVHPDIMTGTLIVL